MKKALGLKRIQIELTEGQLEDLISCVDFGIRQGIAYGHCTQSEQALHEANRKRLLTKLEKSRQG